MFSADFFSVVIIFKALINNKKLVLYVLSKKYRYCTVYSIGPVCVICDGKYSTVLELCIEEPTHLYLS